MAAPRQLLFGCRALFGIHTHLEGTWQEQFLSTPGVFSLFGEEFGGDFCLATGSSKREFLANQILVERNGSTSTFVNVLIVTDSHHGLRIFRGGLLWQFEEGRRASQAFIPLSLPLSC